MNRSIFIWCIAALFGYYQFFLRVSPTAMQDGLKTAFQLDATQLGILVSSYYYAYALMQIPTGFILRWMGTRLGLTFGCILCALGALLLASTDVYSIGIIARLMIGVGSAFSMIGCLKISAEWFPSRNYGFLSGMTLGIGTIGSLSAGSPLTHVVETYGWQQPLIVAGLSGLVLAVILGVFLRNKPPHHADPEAGAKGLSWKFIRKLLLQPQSWLAALLGGALYVPISILGDLWGTPFLVKKLGCTATEAAATVSIIFIGVGIGGPLAGWVSDRLRRRKAVTIAGSLGAALLSLVIIYVPMTSTTLMAVFIFGMGIFLGAQVLMFPIIRESNPSSIESFGAGFVNGTGMLIASISLPVVGGILDKCFPDTTASTGQCMSVFAYPLSALQDALLTMPCVLGVVGLLMFFLKETHAQSFEERHGRKVA